MYSTVGDTTGEVLGWTKADKLSPDSMDRRVPALLHVHCM